VTRFQVLSTKALLPHTTIYVSSYYHICVLILLHMCPHSTIYVFTKNVTRFQVLPMKKKKLKIIKNKKCDPLPGPSYKGAPSEEVVDKGMDGVGVGRGERGGRDRGGAGVDVVNVSKFEY
jgi:hypothetical protein